MPDQSHVVDALRAAYGTWGYPLVLLDALLENTALLGLVLPGGSLVLLGAVYVQQGVLAWPLVLVLGWLGMVLGTSLDYAFGRWALRATLGQTRLTAHPVSPSPSTTIGPERMRRTQCASSPRHAGPATAPVSSG